MNVHPTLPDHAKYLMYKATLGHPDALEFLLRVWAHCQVKSRGSNWGKVTDRYLEISVRWPGAPGALFAALSAPYENKPGWVHRKKSGELVVSGWDEHNVPLINAWKNGAKGGKPATSKKNQPVTRGLATGTPPAPGGEPTANPILVDQSRSDQISTKKTEREKGNSGEARNGNLAAEEKRERRVVIGRMRGEISALASRLSDLTPEERATLKKKRADLDALQKKQAADAAEVMGGPGE